MRMRGMLVSAVLTIGVCVSGCGGPDVELVDLHGTVTMDGEPLPDAHIVFKRADHTGRPSYGHTDENGFYTLGYSRDYDGVLLGDFIVTISTYSDMPYTDENGETYPATRETVPVQYNKDTELTATVKEQGQEVNFDLTSDGKIVQGGW